MIKERYITADKAMQAVQTSDVIFDNPMWREMRTQVSPPDANGYYSLGKLVHIARSGNGYGRLDSRGNGQLKIYIKYMVSLRCKMVVKDELQKLGISYSSLDLGMVELTEEISDDQRRQLKENLLVSGLEVLEGKKAILIEKIKKVVIEMVHYADELPVVNYSTYISEKLNYDYTYLSNIFSEVKGMTIQKYIILHKIEKVKELLLYDELSLTEIAYKLGYSSAAHLSTQFKKVIGLTPSYFRGMKEKRTNNLENF
jgi:AraC-like DNA-binding protein